MKRIAITQRVMRLEGTGEICDRLDQHWTVFLEGLGYSPVLVPTLTSDPAAYVRALRVQGIILSGGNNVCSLMKDGFTGITDAYPCRDAVESKLIDYCMETNMPLLGVCRGLQMIVSHFDGKLQRISGHVNKLHTVSFVDNNRLGIEGSVEVNSFHDFGVSAADLPEELEAIALCDTQFVEAVSHANKNLHGIMWHPEREPELAVDEQIFLRVFGGAN